MAVSTIEGACAFAWHTYLLLHGDVSENDGRRRALHQYISSLYDAGERDLEFLQVAALVYLKNLNQSGKDQEVRSAPQERWRAA